MAKTEMSRKFEAEHATAVLVLGSLLFLWALRRGFRPVLAV